MATRFFIGIDGGAEISKLPYLAGEDKASVRKTMGEPLSQYSLKDYNALVPAMANSWEPDPRTQEGIDEVWEYSLSSVRMALIYFKNGVAVKIWHGAT